MPHTLRLLLVALPLVVLACDSGTADGQRLFADDALLSPVAGITRTDASATVLSRDSSDWRIGPAYLTRVRFLELPSPNPVASGAAISFLIDTEGVPGGLELVAVQRRGDLVDFVEILDPGARRDDATVSGFYSFSVSASQIAVAGGSGVGGLTRVVLLDGRGGVVSYGDVQVNQ